MKSTRQERVFAFSLHSRRSFLSAAALAAPAAFAAAKAPFAGGGKPLKICVFADLHYHPGWLTNSENTVFLEKIQARALQERCDAIIHLGDLVHGVKGAKEKALVKKYNDFAIPSYHCLGNHDQDKNPYEMTCEAYRMPKDGYYSFDMGGFRFLVTDPNYIRTAEGEYRHFSSGNYFKPGKGASINWIPPTQMEWMRYTILESPYPCIIASHQSYERCPEGGSVRNRDEVLALFSEANAKRPGNVRVVMNGHLHVDNLRIIDNILYWDVNSANNYWFPGTHRLFPEEYHKANRLANHNLAWCEPLSGILTLWPDGRVRIQGSKADWLFGITPEKAKFRPFDVDGRRIANEIKSADMTFHYG